MIEEAIKTIGTAHAGLSALIGTRLVSGAQQELVRTLPFVTFEKDGFRPVSAVYVDTDWGYTDITFTVHAATLLEALQVNAQVIAAFNRYQGTVGGVQIDCVGTLLTGQAEDDYDHELDHHLVDQGITFMHSV